MKRTSILVALIGLNVTPAFCWDYTGNYTDVPPEDCGSIQTPAIIETVKVGGFALQLDRVEMGYRIWPSPMNGTLGEFEGAAFRIKVVRIPQNGQPLEKLATEMNAAGEHVSLSPVRARGLTGLRAEYGGKPNLFSQNIRAIRYFFVNPEGQTICFDATSTAPNTDWSIVKHFIGDTIRLAHS